jgi:UDP-N-acetylglucosamine--N-acetylmuramyl-(pentapeptide) pyrophosphoryl-undecaprenol N-acetylglucosamine transferase
MTEEYRILIAGGGTGGHLYPALAIGAELQRRLYNGRIHYVGTSLGIDRTIFNTHGVEYTLLPIKGFQRGVSWNSLKKNTLLPGRLFRAYRQAKKLIETFQPHVTVGTGGYTSALPLYIASKQNIPTLIQEQNSIPGLTTRWLADRAKYVCTSYPETATYLKKKTVVSLATRYVQELTRGIA